MEVIFNGPAMSTLSFHEEDLELGEDFFIWPRPMDPRKPLFMVDDASEQATWEAASQNHEGVWETLSKLGHVVVGGP